MLGLNRETGGWRWKAIGKHPAAADYIDLNSGTPLMEAVAAWVAKGYAELMTRRSVFSGTCSWRFWVRGSRKGALVCGVGRDSSDRIGRPFPLLVLGEGPLKGWERNWVQLPFLLDRTWAQIERIASQRITDLTDLNGALRQLVAPQLETDPAGAHRSAALETDRSEVERYRRVLAADGRVVVPLNRPAGVDPDSAAVHWQGLLAACCPDGPRAVFLGGHPQGTFLALVQQPLATSDFIALWSV